MIGPAPLLVVGARGLLGTAVRRRAAARGMGSTAARIAWPRADEAVADLEAAVNGTLREAAGRAWSIVWCAGAGVTASSDDDLDSEIAVMAGFVDALVGLPAEALHRCTVFFASSAGSIYAGSANPPFTEDSLTASLAAYGRAKLRAEAEFARLSEFGVRVAMGRISNLYGPGQNLAKPQGLISQMCLAHHLARPIGIYVSLDTLRDYLYVDDCAELVLDLLMHLGTIDPGSPPVIKILAAQSSVTIASLIGTLRALNKKKPQAILAASPLGARGARDLRFRSVVLPQLDRRPLTPLPVGIAATSEDIGFSLRLHGPR